MEEQNIFSNSGKNIDSLPIINLLHGSCSATRAKLSVVPEPVTTLIDRNNWEDWDSFLATRTKGKFQFLNQFFK